MFGSNALPKNYKNIVEQIKKIDLKSVNDEELLKRSDILKEKAIEGTEINAFLVEGFALVKEAVRRTLKFEVYDVQLLAAIALHNKKMIEMKTGEGKTLTAVFPAYLNGLLKKGVHILTFNDYLARRDALWMKPVYEALGLTVGFVQEKMDKKEKKNAYNCDITYVTAKEAGFDYLRDSLCYNKEDLIHRQFHFAIVDEADSILVDEARIPLVIAVSTNEKAVNLQRVRDAIETLDPLTDYKTDEYSQNVYLTEIGIDHVENLLQCGNLYDKENWDLLAKVNSALYAEVLLQKDIDYIVRKGIIEMVDEFTGRVAENRHWPDGLQEALECKENLEIRSKGRIMAKITLQHFIKLYENLAGMTGTAVDSADELYEFYDMEVVIIPPNKKSLRKDCTPYVFTHKEAKYKALVEEIKRVHATGQPILIGTSSVKESSYLASQLLAVRVKCQVLNAKNDELEASIIAKAGVLGAVTVSTNMAGRGTDILLGGPDGYEREHIKELGGLYVIGTNLYESLRIDKQLMGRSGRQGDPGITRFFVSLEDDLMVRYGIENVIPEGYLPKKQDKALPNAIFNRKMHEVQKIVQGQNSDLRMDLYHYSSVLDGQRQYMYDTRMKIINDESDILKKNILLYHMDQCFADYLNKAANFQEGIQLCILGGKSPLREFEMKLAEEFNLLQEEIYEAVKDDYTKLEASEITVEELIERSKPPASTWTYLVSDNSFEDIIGMFRGLDKLLGFSKPIAELTFAAEYKWNELFKEAKNAGLG